MAEPNDDFTAFAKAALGTDDPDRIAALKEAIKACEAGEYDEEKEAPAGESDMLSAMMGGGG